MPILHTNIPLPITGEDIYGPAELLAQEHTVDAAGITFDDATVQTTAFTGSALPPAGTYGEIEVVTPASLWRPVYWRFVGSAFIGGNQTGNARGANALDVQASRSAVTQVASGANAACFGLNNTASASTTAAIGSNNTVSGSTSVGVGRLNVVSGSSSVAIGFSNLVAGIENVGIGSNHVTNPASASNVLIGQACAADPLATLGVMIGIDCRINGLYSAAIGYGNRALSDYSCTIGFGIQDFPPTNTVRVGTGPTDIYFGTGTEKAFVDFDSSTGDATFTSSVSLGRFNANILRTVPTTVGSLGSAATAGAGARRFVTDANSTTFASIVASGGANGVPVYSDGINWRVG
jgi:hypothetical protein